VKFLIRPIFCFFFCLRCVHLPAGFQLFADLHGVGKLELSSPVLLGMTRLIRNYVYDTYRCVITGSSETVAPVKQGAWMQVPLPLNSVREVKEQLAPWLMSEQQQMKALF